MLSTPSYSFYEPEKLNSNYEMDKLYGSSKKKGGLLVPVALYCTGRSFLLMVRHRPMMRNNTSMFLSSSRTMDYIVKKARERRQTNSAGKTWKT
jgi:hypothetical protein